MFVCRYCNHIPKLKTAMEVYGRNIGDCNFYWVCPLCGAMVGCKKGTTKPMGELANAQTRKLRIEAHRAFDPIWKKQILRRDEAYFWLAKQLGLTFNTCHFSLMSDINLIKTVDICNKFLKEEYNE